MHGFYLRSVLRTSRALNLFCTTSIAHGRNYVLFIYRAVPFYPIRENTFISKRYRTNITVVHIYIMKLLKTLGYHILLPPKDI